VLTGSITSEFFIPKLLAALHNLGASQKSNYAFNSHIYVAKKSALITTFNKLRAAFLPGKV